jgi:hypothetical protein
LASSCRSLEAMHPGPGQTRQLAGQRIPRAQRDRYRREIAYRQIPEERQLQFLLGTLLGSSALRPAPEGTRFVLQLAARHAWLADWTYTHLAPFVPAPLRASGRVEIRAEPHPLFAILAPLLRRPRGLRHQLAPSALWVWATHQRVGECEARKRPACDCAKRRLSATS